MVDLFLPAAPATEALLADECAALLGPRALVRAQRGGVNVRGGPREAMLLNLHSRLAQRVLWPLAAGGYRDEHDLYDLARTVDWSGWITPRHSLRVDVTAQRSPLRSLHFAALRIKDGVCDDQRDRLGARPDVNTRDPDLPLLLHLGPEQATLYADLSGEALFKRGWRDGPGAKGEAPLKETLAAAMLAAAGWRGRAEDGPLLDPCCGAGTIAIEAAQLACGIAPGLNRRFAFERLLPFQGWSADWQQLREAALAARHAPAVPVFAGDVSFRMTDFAGRNAQRAGVADAIAFKTADALQRPPPVAAGTMLLNPPYGERIEPGGTAPSRQAAGPSVEGDDFFGALAAHFKRHYAGWTAWILSPDAGLAGRMRLKPSRRVPLWNGTIECRMYRFDLVAGRHGRHADAADAGDPAPPDGAASDPT
ncbi:MAG: class I SAM-dependent RNA methyltransferase [Aquabacterium sp.]